MASADNGRASHAEKVEKETCSQNSTEATSETKKILLHCSETIFVEINV
jgi:hypothetical protein